MTQLCHLTVDQLLNNGRRDVTDPCPKCRCFIYDHTIQQPAQVTTTLPTKRFKLHLLPTEKYEVTRVLDCEISSNSDIKEMCKISKGLLVDESDKIVNTYDGIVEGATYSFAGGFYDAVKNDVVRRQSDDKVLEAEGAAAVEEHVRLLGHSNVHTHANEKFLGENKESVLKVDAIVHIGGENIQGSMAYLVETANAPKPYEVDVIEGKVRLFQSLTKSHPHYKTVETVVPVLVGRRWSPETLKRARVSKLLIVKPNGSGYSAIRLFSTFAKLLK